MDSELSLSESGTPRSRSLRPPFEPLIPAMVSPEADLLCYVDQRLGTLNRLDLVSGCHLGIVNREHFDDLGHEVQEAHFADATALFMDETQVLCARSDRVSLLEIDQGVLRNERVLPLPEVGEITGISAHQRMVYIAARDGRVVICDQRYRPAASREVGRPIDSMTVHADSGVARLLLLDTASRAVHVHDLSGKHRFSITLPHEGATAIASAVRQCQRSPVVYVSYSRRTWEVIDDAADDGAIGNDLNLRLDPDAINTVIEPLSYGVVDLGDADSAGASRPGVSNACISNGYRIELVYTNLLRPVPEARDGLGRLRIKLRHSVPVSSRRQTVVSLASFGEIPGFLTRDQAGNSIMEYDLSHLRLDREQRAFGYRAVVDLYGIRYAIGNSPAVPRQELPPEVQPYLACERRYDMHRRELQEVAEGILRKMSTRDRCNMISIARAIREFVYDNLTYRYNRRLTTPVETLHSGEGTCGKYTELLLGLLRLAGIPSRAVGDYKVPDYKLAWGEVGAYCRPDYDHVWLEIYLPGVGWIPMESSSDDLPGRHDRFFAALPWVNIENSRTVRSREIIVLNPREPSTSELTFSDLFLKDVQLRVVGEVAPGSAQLRHEPG